jgi:hypothetical protein
MKRRFLALLIVSTLLTLSGCTKWAEKSHPSWREATSGEHLVNLFWNEVKAKNWAGLEAHVGAEFMGISPDKTMDRAGLMEHLKGIDLESFQVGEVETRPAGKDLLVSYIITARGSHAGQSLPETPIRMMSVWQELGHGWVLVAHSDVAAAGRR